MAIEYEILRDADLFSEMDERSLRDLAQYCTRIELLAGATLIEQNAPGDALYVLESGQVHILRQYEDGTQVILATEVPWYIVGDLSMLAALPRTGTVVAVSDCTLLALQRSAFIALCERHPDLALRILGRLAQRLYRMNLRVRENAIGNVAARVASLLLLTCAGRESSALTELRISRVARAVATDVDVVEQLFAHWSQEDLLHFAHGRLELRDITRLERIAGQGQVSTSNST